MSLKNSWAALLFLSKLRPMNNRRGMPAPIKSKLEIEPILIHSKYCIDNPAEKNTKMAASVLSIKNATSGIRSAEPSTYKYRVSI